MLAKQARLRTNREISEVVRRGRRLTSPYVRLYAVRRPAGKVSRVACVVGKRVSASAVVRHRYQRWLRVLARDWVQGRASGTAYDMVWVAQPAMANVKQLAELAASMTPLLQKIT